MNIPLKLTAISLTLLMGITSLTMAAPSPWQLGRVSRQLCDILNNITAGEIKNISTISQFKDKKIPADSAMSQIMQTQQYMQANYVDYTSRLLAEGNMEPHDRDFALDFQPRLVNTYRKCDLWISSFLFGKPDTISDVDYASMENYCKVEPQNLYNTHCVPPPPKECEDKGTRVGKTAWRKFKRGAGVELCTKLAEVNTLIAELAIDNPITSCDDAFNDAVDGYIGEQVELLTDKCATGEPKVDTGSGPKPDDPPKQPHSIPESCLQIKYANPEAQDGIYQLDPDGLSMGSAQAFLAYCDMTTDGGGWTLVAKVHRRHNGAPIDEPEGWFAMTRDAESLINTTSYEMRAVGQASHGQGRLGPLAQNATLARFVIVAEDDIYQRATWYKSINSEVWKWFSLESQSATQVCTDVNMTQKCKYGTIQASTEGTWMQGMNLSDIGYSTIDWRGVCPIHMRLNGDQTPQFGAVCSCTSNNDSNAWHDDVDGHWGNGLEIWFR